MEFLRRLIARWWWLGVITFCAVCPLIIWRWYEDPYLVSFPSKVGEGMARWWLSASFVVTLLLTYRINRRYTECQVSSPGSSANIRWAGFVNHALGGLVFLAAVLAVLPQLAETLRVWSFNVFSCVVAVAVLYIDLKLQNEVEHEEERLRHVAFFLDLPVLIALVYATLVGILIGGASPLIDGRGFADNTDGDFVEGFAAGTIAVVVILANIQFALITAQGGRFTQGAGGAGAKS